MMSYLFLGGREILSSSTKRKALYTLLYLVHMIAVCSVVDRIAAILLYMHCLTGTKMHERGIVAKCSQCERVQMRESSSNIS